MLAPDLDGRTALVTGSARGLGRDLVLALAACGARVAVHYRTSADAAADTADDARDAGAPAATTVQGDVTDPGSVDALVDAATDDLGRLDVLVNNVGDFAPTHWADLAFEDWKRVVETNLYGTYLCTRRALPDIRSRAAESGYGRVVNVGYAGSDRAMASAKNFPYFAAKTGVAMFTRTVAADTQDDDVTVNEVAPYVVETSDAFPDDLPRGRPARTEEVAHAMLFFLHPDSGYVSGERIDVDGGWLPESV
ncbi:MAG: SDR family NAD(P)-dependent oxidoreductase [Haloarculaceae archaeon]